MARELSSSHEDAGAIYQGHLDRLTRALFAGDFESFSAGLRFPHHVKTATDSFETPDKVSASEQFADYRKSIEAEGITDLIRLLEDARFVTPQEIVGTHVSHKIRGATRIMEPYHNRVRLVRGADGEWRETHCANAVRNKAGKFSIVTPSANQMQAPELDPTTKRNDR